MASADIGKPLSEFEWREQRLPWLEFCLVFVRLEVHKTWEQQNHVPSLVHYGRMAERAADFARQLVLDGLVCRIVPLKIVVAVREVDVILVEDCRPLEGCSYKKSQYEWIPVPVR